MGLLVSRVSSVEYNGLTPDFYITVGGSTDYTNDGTTPATAVDIRGLNDATFRTRYAQKTVGVIDGTYDLYSIMGVPPSGNHFDNDCRLQIAAGISGTPTVVVSQTPRGAIIKGGRAQLEIDQPGLNWGIGLLGAVTDYVTIDGFRFTDCHYCAIKSSGGDELTIKNCRFDDLDFSQVTGQGYNSSYIWVSTTTTILIQNCRFEGGRASGDSDRHFNITFSQPNDGMIVEYCTFIAGTNTSRLIHPKNVGNKDVIIRYCFLDYSASSAPVSGGPINYDGSNDSADTAVIHNNVIIAGSGTHIIDNDSHQGNYAIYNNTLVGDWSTSGVLKRMDNGPPSGVDFYNNIVFPTTGGGDAGEFSVDDRNDLGTCDYNMYKEGTIKFTEMLGSATPTNTWTTLSSWASDSGKEGNSTQDDPEFVATGSEADYYKLGGASPAKSFDVSGNDIGAWGGASPPTQVGSDF